MRNDEVMLACVGTPSECHPVSNGFLFTKGTLQPILQANLWVPFLFYIIQQRLSEHIASQCFGEAGLPLFDAQRACEQKPHGPEIDRI